MGVLASWHEGLLAIRSCTQWSSFLPQCNQITTGEKQAAALLLSSRREEAIKMPHLAHLKGISVTLASLANLKPKKAASHARALSAAGPPYSPLPQRQYLTGSHLQNSVHDARGIPRGHMRSMPCRMPVTGYLSHERDVKEGSERYR